MYFCDFGCLFEKKLLELLVHYLTLEEMLKLAHEGRANAKLFLFPSGI